MIYSLFLKFVMMIVVIFGSVFLGLFFSGIDRILSARMQKRIGPPLFQPFYDINKLMVKESIIPRYAVKWIFELSPIISLVASILILFYVPIAGRSILSGSGDLILVIYLFIIPGLSIVLGAFSSNSPYANIGGQRLVINMLGYEFPLAIAALAPVWVIYKNEFSNVFSLNTIYAHNIWKLASPIGIVGILIEIIVFLAVIMGELSKSPFDIESADSEIVGGALAEYSGRNLAIFHLAEDVKMIAISSLFITLFFPLNIQANFVMQFLVYLLKLFIIMFGIVLTKTAISRFKVSRLTRVYWLYVGLLAIIGFLFLL